MRQMRAPKTIVTPTILGCLRQGDIFRFQGDEERKVYYAGWIFGCIVPLPVCEDGSVGADVANTNPSAGVLLIDPQLLGIVEVKQSASAETPGQDPVAMPECDSEALIDGARAKGSPKE